MQPPRVIRQTEIVRTHANGSRPGQHPLLQSRTDNHQKPSIAIDVPKQAQPTNPFGKTVLPLLWVFGRPGIFIHHTHNDPPIPQHIQDMAHIPHIARPISARRKNLSGR
jgi:hypothetical protein